MKAIALLSGGLDSTVAARVIQEQGIEVVGVNFKTAFGTRPQQKNGAARDRAQEAAQNLKIELKSIDISEDFLKLLKNPGHEVRSVIPGSLILRRIARSIRESVLAECCGLGQDFEKRSDSNQY